MVSRYTLEVYEPGSERNVLTTFEMETPFIAMVVGQQLNMPEHLMNPLTITRVEHILWNTEKFGTKQKVMIFTANHGAEIGGARARSLE